MRLFADTLISGGTESVEQLLGPVIDDRTLWPSEMVGPAEEWRVCVVAATRSSVTRRRVVSLFEF